MTENFTLRQLCESYAALMRLGFLLTMDIRDVLSKRIQGEPDLEE
jgi:hypothetical protein